MKSCQARVWKERGSMESKNYYLILAIVTGILCICASGEVEQLQFSGVIGRVNPALSGIEKLYVVVEPADARPSKDGLVWKELQEKIEQKLEKAGIKIAGGIHTGQKVKTHERPELRVYMEMLKFTDSRLYVFRVQTSLAAKAYLEEQGLFFKAEVWKTEPVMQAVSVRGMPVKVTNAVLEQTEVFIHAYLAANPQGVPNSNNVKTILPTARKEPVRPAVKPAAAEYEYVASKNSKVFHKAECSWAKRIKPENIAGYDSRDEAVKAGRRACKQCKP